MSKKIGKTVPKCSVTSRREFPAITEGGNAMRAVDESLFLSFMEAVRRSSGEVSVTNEQMGESNN